MKKAIIADNRQVLGYTRYSSDNQQYLSIEAQKDKILAYAKIMGLEVDEIIQEPKALIRAEGGKGFEELVNRIKSNQINAVIVPKHYRYQRDIEQSRRFYRLLKKYDVKLVVVNDRVLNKNKSLLGDVCD